jgi:hypothetical protein
MDKREYEDRLYYTCYSCNAQNQCNQYIQKYSTTCKELRKKADKQKGK